MLLKKNKKQNKIAEVIGASRVIPLTSKRLGGPLDWLQLAQKLQARLVSKGGRPSDPHWNTRRLVPFRTKTWKLLTKEAEIISTEGRKVGPAQLAAIVIEERFTEVKGVSQFYILKSVGLSSMSHPEPQFISDISTFPNNKNVKSKTEWVPEKIFNPISLVS